MITFLDRYGRPIETEIEMTDAVAKCGDREVGRVSTTGPQEVDDYQPAAPATIIGMFVDNDFGAAGIGLELIRLLYLEFGPLQPARKNEGRGGQNALTDDGLRLTSRAQKLGFVLPFDDTPVSEN